MKIKIFLFILFIINIVKCEFSITNTSPSYLVNSNDDLTINTIDGPTDANDASIFFLTYTGTWVKLAEFTMPTTNQFIIGKDQLFGIYGERLFRVQIISTNTFTNNYAKIGFATPYLETVGINSTTLNFIATCGFLNNSDYTTQLAGISLNPVAPIAIHEPISSLFLYKLEFSYSQIQYIRAYPYLQCSNSKSAINIDYPGLLPTPDTNSLTWEKIPRKGGLFKYSGKNLYPLDGNNQTAYTFDFHFANDTTLNPGILCKNTTVVKYNGNQHYDCSCIVDEYYEPAVNGMMITTQFPSIGQQQFNYKQFYLDPTVLSVSSTFYGTPQEVTIKARSLCIEPNVTIGGSKCEVRLSDYENDVLYCKFNSDVPGLQDTHRVSIDCFSQIGYADIFIYKVDECALSQGFNGQVCSGNGTCIEDIRKCNCTKGYFGLDCSQSNNGGNNENVPSIDDNGNTIIETDDSRFDIGLVQVRELNIDNQVEQVYNLTSAIWNFEQSSNNNTEQLYNTTLANGSIIKTLLTLNLNSNDIEYDFYGDVLTIAPNNVKYKITISNWDFKASLNTLQLIFQTQLSIEQCDKTELIGKQNVIKYEDSIRSLELTLKNGQTLIGTFSNRMKVDDRVIKSEVKLLTVSESIGIPSISKINKTDSDKTQSIQNLYTAISITSFASEAIVDPNFGLLVSSDVSREGKCGKKFESWKIALIVVFGVVGVALIIIGVAIYKGRNRDLVRINGKIVSLKNLNKEESSKA